MPSIDHEAVLALARLEPDLPYWAAVRLCGLDLPAYHRASPWPAEMRELVPPRPGKAPGAEDGPPREYRSDNMTAYYDERGAAVLGLDFERQRDRSKRLARLKHYAVALEDELDAPAFVLMQCSSRALARYYRQLAAADAGTSGSQLFPAVYCDGDVPRVADPAQAREHPAQAREHPAQAREHPALAVLSLISHARRPHVDALFPALAAAIRAAVPKLAVGYDDISRAALSKAAEKRWEAYVTATHLDTEFLSDHYRGAVAKGKAEGKAEERAESVLAVLTARKVAVRKADRERILACSDLDKLATWLERAAMADSVADVLR